MTRRRKHPPGEDRIAEIRRLAPIVDKRVRRFDREFEIRRRRREREAAQPKVVVVERVRQVGPVIAPEDSYRLIELDALLGIGGDEQRDEGACKVCGRRVGRRGDGLIRRHRLKPFRGGPVQPFCAGSPPT